LNYTRGRSYCTRSASFAHSPPPMPSVVSDSLSVTRRYVKTTPNRVVCNTCRPG